MNQAVKAVARPLYDDLEDAIVRGILRAVRRVKDATTVREIQDAIERGDTQAALDAVKMELGTAELETFIPQSLRSAYENAGTMAASSLGRQIQAEMRVSFDLLNPESVAWLRESAGLLISNFGQTSLDAIRAIITTSYRTGSSPYEVARLIRESGIGLTERGAVALENYRNALTAESKWTAAQVESMTRAYGDRLLRQRARLIARTEILRAEGEGNRALWRQAKERGLLGGGAELEWQTTGQENVCPECDELNGETIPVGGLFSAGVEGPPLHPACSCVAVLHPYGSAA